MDKWKVSIQLSQESETSRTGWSSVSHHCRRISTIALYLPVWQVCKEIYIYIYEEGLCNRSSPILITIDGFGIVFSPEVSFLTRNSILDREIRVYVDAWTSGHGPWNQSNSLFVQPFTATRDDECRRGPIERREFGGFGFRGDRGNDWWDFASTDFCLMFASELDFTVALWWQRVKARAA